MSLLLRALMVILAGVLVGSCELQDEPEAEGETPEPASVGDTVQLTTYLRTGSSDEAMLRPVARDVLIEGDLNRRAVELLLEGPTEEEGLEAPWPEGTEVRRVTVEGGVATVDLSSEALDGDDSEHSTHLELLALGSLANTLTEFPTIKRVRLTIEGESSEDSREVAAFWGGWGLPRTLPRDETLVGEITPSTPVLSGFMAGRQTLGSENADPVLVRSVRVRDRITYVRLVIELADAADPNSSAPEFPRAYARTLPDGAVLEVTDVDGIDEGGMLRALDPALSPYLADVDVSDGQRPHSMRLTLQSDSAGRKGIRLHTRDSPSRIVLDIRK